MKGVIPALYWVEQEKLIKVKWDMKENNNQSYVFIYGQPWPTTSCPGNGEADVINSKFRVYIRNKRFDPQVGEVQTYLEKDIELPANHLERTVLRLEMKKNYYRTSKIFNSSI